MVNNKTGSIMIELDGRTGEGGGQILRSALTLSMITGVPFRISHIRARRPRPGLMRQHLVAVQAATIICNADTADVRPGAQALEFKPGKIKGSDYQFAIGTAGSCTLVLQTLIPALLFADKASSIQISGGTHNPMAPPAEFLQKSYCRVLEQMGAQVNVALQRYGFYPASGGALQASVTPATLRPVDLLLPGKRISARAEAVIAGVPGHVAQRELETVANSMGWTPDQLHIRGLQKDQGPGNILLLMLEQEHVTEVFSGFGEKTVSAENVARKAVKQLRHYVASGAAVGEYLADQIMLLFALAGGGSYTTHRVSAHAQTNAAVIGQFLPVSIQFHPDGENTRITVISQ